MARRLVEFVASMLIGSVLLVAGVSAQHASYDDMMNAMKRRRMTQSDVICYQLGKEKGSLPNEQWAVVLWKCSERDVEICITDRGQYKCGLQFTKMRQTRRINTRDAQYDVYIFDRKMTGAH